MKLLNRLIFKNMKLNRKITIVIIIGIILSTFLLTSVVTIVSSFQKSMLEYTREINGDYHYEFFDVPIAELNNITNTRLYSFKRFCKNRCFYRNNGNHTRRNQ